MDFRKYKISPNYNGVNWAQVQSHTQIKKSYENALKILRVGVILWIAEFIIGYSGLDSSGLAKSQVISSLVVGLGIVNIFIAVHNFIKFVFQLLEEDDKPSGK